MWWERMSKTLHICMLVVALLIILLLLCLGGCASTQQATQVLWHDGNCLFFVDGVSAQQAVEMTKDWEFEPCEIKLESEMGKGEVGSEDFDGVEGS